MSVRLQVVEAPGTAPYGARDWLAPLASGLMPDLRTYTDGLTTYADGLCWVPSTGPLELAKPQLANAKTSGLLEGLPNPSVKVADPLQRLGRVGNVG